MSGMLKSDSAKTALSVVFVIAIAAAFCSNVSVLIDGIRKLTRPVLSCWYFSVVIPRQRSPLL